MSSKSAANLDGGNSSEDDWDYERADIEEEEAEECINTSPPQEPLGTTASSHPILPHSVPKPVVPKPVRRGQMKEIPAHYGQSFSNENFKSFVGHMPVSIGIIGCVDSERETIIYRNDARPEASKNIMFEIPNTNLNGQYYYLRLVNLKNIETVYKFPPFDSKTFPDYKKIIKMDANGGIIVKKEHLFVKDTTRIAIARSRERKSVQTSFPLSSHKNSAASFAICFVPLKDGVYMFNEAVRTKHFTVMSSNNKRKKKQRPSPKRPKKGNSDERDRKVKDLQFNTDVYIKRTEATKRKNEALSFQIKQIRDLFASVQRAIPEIDGVNFNMNMRYHTRPDKVQAVSF